MKKSRHSESQIIQILNEGEAGVPITDICREHGISRSAYYKWKSKYGGMDVHELKHLRELETENRRVINEGYADDLTDSEIEQVGRDPLLIAYALKHSNGRCVVTTEASKPKKQRANRHVPDVCDILKVSWCHTFGFIRILGFSTNWKAIK